MKSKNKSNKKEKKIISTVLRNGFFISVTSSILVLLFLSYRTFDINLRIDEDE